MSGPQALLAAARRDLGVAGRPNKMTREYAARHGAEYLRAAWCNMAVTYWARHSGTAASILPAGDRAYTVAHAEDGRRLGRWHAGTVANILRYAEPGCPIFFDWGGTDEIARIDHIGLIEQVLPDGRVQTIEANTGGGEGMVKRRVRGADVIAGFWVPDWSKSKEDNVSPKQVWQHELPVPYGSPENPEWQAGNILTNHGVWLRKVTGKVDDVASMLKALSVELQALREEVAELRRAPSSGPAQG